VHRSDREGWASGVLIQANRVSRHEQLQVCDREDRDEQPGWVV
jgi:hypothetical protein